jgi:hypothetical protein
MVVWTSLEAVQEAELSFDTTLGHQSRLALSALQNVSFAFYPRS